MEVSEKTSKSGFRGRKLTAWARYFNVEGRKLAVFFKLGCEGDVRMLVVKLVKKKRYVVEGFEHKKQSST